MVASWQQEHERRQRRDLSGRRFVYIRDGVYVTPRLDHDRQCLLVVIGADDDLELPLDLGQRQHTGIRGQSPAVEGELYRLAGEG